MFILFFVIFIKKNDYSISYKIAKNIMGQDVRKSDDIMDLKADTINIESLYHKLLHLENENLNMMHENLMLTHQIDYMLYISHMRNISYDQSYDQSHDQSQINNDIARMGILSKRIAYLENRIKTAQDKQAKIYDINNISKHKIAQLEHNSQKL